MPEGPEIRLAADRVFDAIGGAPLTDVVIDLPALHAYARTLTGERVTAIDTRGKAMLTRFSNGLTMYSHNQLYGRWFAVKDGPAPDTRRNLRVALHTAKGSAYLYSATDIEMLTAVEIDEHPFLLKLGPDVLDPTLKPAAIAKRLREPAFARRRLGTLYLDQGFLAGNGNYLRSEILHFAGLHPMRRPEALTAAERQHLARTTLRIAKRSYARRGVTNPARVATRLRRRGWTYGRYRFAVFGRGGRPCHTCGAEIDQINMGRRLYFCPSCQPPE